MTPTLFSISYAGFWGQDSLDLNQFIPRAAAMGYSSVMLAGKRPNLSPLDTNDETIARLKSLLAEHHVGCAVVAGYTDFAASTSAASRWWGVPRSSGWPQARGMTG